MNDYVFWDEGTYECISLSHSGNDDEDDPDGPRQFTVKVEADGSCQDIPGLQDPDGGGEFLSNLWESVMILKVD